MVSLDEVIPSPDFWERYERHIAASPTAVWHRLHDVPVRQPALSRTLLTMRALREGLAGAQPSQLLGIDFVLHPVVGATRPATEARGRETGRRTGARPSIFWTVIRAGSGLMRRVLLRAAGRRAGLGASPMGRP